MPTYYINPAIGGDGNAGDSFAVGHAWKTINGAIAATIAPGDTIKIAKSPDPTSLGDADWHDGPIPVAVAPASSTDATPIHMTKVGHGLVTGDIVFITGHTVNTNANGLWVITRDDNDIFSLNDSTGTGGGAGGATGTYQKWNSKVVQLETACVAEIDNCDVAWTSTDLTNITVTADTVDWKEGYKSFKAVFGANAGTGLSAYKTFAVAKNLSAYDQISFWIKNSVALAAGDLHITLCEADAGVTPHDTFDVPAIPSVNQWVCFTIDNAGPLHTDIHSIGLEQVVDKGAMTIYLDNVIACYDDVDANSLTLTSLISKNSAAQGGDEGWYGIQSIKGPLVVLDNVTNTLPNTRYGYSGDDAHCETFKRECFRLTLGTILSTAIQTMADAGTAGSLITFEGGYDTSSGDRNGETFFDGGNSFGVGLTCTAYTTINGLNFVRYYYGILISNRQGCECIDIQTIACCTYGVYLAYCRNLNWTTVKNIINNTYGLYLTINKTCCRINKVQNTSNNVYGFWLQSQMDFIINEATYVKNNNYSINFNTVWNCRINNITSLSAWGCVFSQYGFNRNIMRNVTITGSTYTLTENYTQLGGGGDPYNWQDPRTYIQDFGSVGVHKMYTESGYVIFQTGTKYGTVGAWEFTSLSSLRLSTYPIRMALLKLQVTNGSTYTVDVYCKKSSASDVAGRLFVRGGQVAGEDNDIVDLKADDTNWEKLSVEINPTADGYVEIEAEMWYVSANGSVYFDSEATVTVT